MNANDILMHYGKLGMKWGKRNSRVAPGPTVRLSTQSGKKVKVLGGGHHHAPSEDAIKAAIIRQKQKKSTIDSLSNKELQDVVQRMNLEKQYSSLKGGRSVAGKFINDFINTAGKQSSQTVSNEIFSQRLGAALKKKG